MYDLRLLGGISLRGPSGPVSGRAVKKRQAALLALLASAGEPGCSRDRLAGYLCPESDEEHARHLIRDSIYLLRRALGEKAVLTVGDALCLNPQVVKTDVAEFQGALARGDEEAAVRVYGGQFIEGFHLEGGSEVEHWADAERKRLAGEYEAALESLARSADARGDLARAVEWWRRLAINDPYNSRFALGLMEALVAAGDPSNALHHAREHERVLREDLGVEAAAEVRARAARLQAEWARGEALTDEVAGTRAEAEPDVTSSEKLVEAYSSLHAQIDALSLRSLWPLILLYVGGAWLCYELIGSVTGRLALPDWLPILALLLLMLGLPATLAAGRLGPSRWLMWRNAALAFTGALTLCVGVASGWLMLRGGPAGAGDRSSIVVFPFTVAPAEQAGLGEDVATWFGYEVEQAGLRWVDGWQQLDEAEREGRVALTGRKAASATRALGSAYYVKGRLSLGGDSVHLLLNLHDVADDSVLARASAASLADEYWMRRVVDQAAGQLMPAIIGSKSAVELVSASDTGEAAREFLQGESAFRRARFSEAYQHYQKAFEADSAFALAALNGALAACWLPEELSVHYERARELLELAMSRPAFLAPHRAHFAHGMWEYLGGRADSAVAYFRRALAIAPEWGSARAQLGEVYTHLLARESPLDSLAEATFLEARGDPTFYPALFHLIETQLRKGRIRDAEDLVREFRVANPDSLRLYQLELMLECVKNSPAMVDWRRHVLEHPDLVYKAAERLAVGGHQTPCARAGWRAIMVHDTAEMSEYGPGFNRRFSTLLALQSLTAAEGRREHLLDLLQSYPAFSAWIGDILVLDALAGAVTPAEARAAVDEIRELYRSGSLASTHIWLLGAWEAHRGRVDEARVLADTLEALAEQSGERLDRLLARSLEARTVLSGGDLTKALELLRALVPTNRPGDPWYPWETLAYEQVALAQLLYARGEYAAAIKVAANLDAPARPAIDLLYLPTSLVLRARAARAIGDSVLERRCRERLSALGRTDLIALLPD